VPLVGRGCDVIGLDLSEEMLRLARGKLATVHGLGSADFVVASAEALPLRSAAVDASVIYGSLHHFADAEAAVREAARVIEPGGQFYMLEPHDSALRPVFEWSMKRWTLWEEEAADEPLFNAQQWEGWLGRCGIQPKIRYSTYLPPHLFYVLKGKVGEAVLSGTDRLFGSLPGVRRLAGVIIAEGAKRG
jgi:SAM-dependent methyltransferase